MTENKKVLKVLNGFSELSETERDIFIREINEYLKKSSFGQSETNREIRVKLQANLGPTNDRNCPCCGKS